MCCSWVVLSVCFLPGEFRESNSVPSFCSLSVSFIPLWQLNCWHNTLKNLVNFPCMCQGFTPLDNRLLCRSILGNPISIPGFCLDGWGHLWVTCLISQRATCEIEYSDLLILLKLYQKVVHPHPWLSLQSRLSWKWTSYFLCLCNLDRLRILHVNKSYFLFFNSASNLALSFHILL